MVSVRPDFLWEADMPSNRAWSAECVCVCVSSRESQTNCQWTRLTHANRRNIPLNIRLPYTVHTHTEWQIIKMLSIWWHGIQADLISRWQTAPDPCSKTGALHYFRHSVLTGPGCAFSCVTSKQGWWGRNIRSLGVSVPQVNPAVVSLMMKWPHTKTNTALHCAALANGCFDTSELAWMWCVESGPGCY